MQSFPGVALVVSASTSIGRATSLQLSKHGCTRLVLVDQDSNQIESLAHECRNAGEQDMEVLVLAGDLNDADTVRRLILQAVEQYGCINYAANCFDMPTTLGSTADMSLEYFKEPAEAVQRKARSLSHIWLWMREEVSQALKQETNKGNSSILSIVNVSTIHGIGSEPHLPACAAASRAIVGMTRATAMDYIKSGIRINCVCHSAVAQQAPSEQKLLPSPLGRYLEVEEVSHAVVFLLAAQSSAITGTQLPVDGGWSLYHY
ncbi:dehydrogenase [Fusarium sp. NRRL 52700]|nr:dehydrogenase [Fusarium sp. NRRL 52700]